MTVTHPHGDICVCARLSVFLWSCLACSCPRFSCGALRGCLLGTRPFFFLY
ncbi:hypothetical protein BU14_0389s0008 [Porphyra umbilicalis]|uniref:Uncharacterized protein n=1 Tax=Porphyra umbilicalis TaxID=2786 RepID=A0A1X6NWR4_PORUM|nr:hypothetical protein BU14_0389s0008 [Porphyra umbilicalis]|eukprot:OSX72985.1 hypothetical protein BU14_0389s0008 [Porphyra umbilicalis]